MDENLNTYNSKEVLNWYKQFNELMPTEKMIFAYYADFIQNATCLDIGIGGGRTTDYLIKSCKRYFGIDYSRGFVDLVKTKFPDANISVLDARNLSFFKDNTFDFVNFSFNGIDYVDLDGRKKILSEMQRVLKPNGILFFSTHNKNHSSFNKFPWKNKNQSVSVNIKTIIKLLPYLGRKLNNKKHEIENEDYAIINDSAHNYALMTFYTSPNFLKKQLSELQFQEQKFYSKSGILVDDVQLDEWIFVTCKKIRI